MANKWHSIDRRIYGEGTGPAHFAEASNAEHAEQIVREHNALASTEIEDVAAIYKFFSFATWALVLATVVSLLIMVRDVSVHDLRSAYDSKWFIVEIACAGAGVIAGALKKGVKSELTQASAALSTQGQKIVPDENRDYVAAFSELRAAGSDLFGEEDAGDLLKESQE